MEVHRQKCQNCESLEHNNLIVRQPGKPQTILVRCAKCQDLVAAYQLDTYYHHGKGFESWLANLKAHRESGRDLMKEFQETQQRNLKLYKDVLETLHSEGKD